MSSMASATLTHGVHRTVMLALDAPICARQLRGRMLATSCNGSPPPGRAPSSRSPSTVSTCWRSRSWRSTSPAPGAEHERRRQRHRPAAVPPRRASGYVAVRHAAGARRRGRRVLHDRRPLVPGGRQPALRLGAVPLRHRVDDLRLGRRRLRALPGASRRSPPSSSSTGGSATGTSSALAQGVGARTGSRNRPSLRPRVGRRALRRASRRSRRAGPTTGTRSRSAGRTSSRTPSTSGRACSTAGTASGSCRTRS